MVCPFENCDLWPSWLGWQSMVRRYWEHHPWPLQLSTLQQLPLLIAESLPTCSTFATSKLVSVSMSHRYWLLWLLSAIIMAIRQHINSVDSGDFLAMFNHTAYYGGSHWEWLVIVVKFQLFWMIILHDNYWLQLSKAHETSLYQHVQLHCFCLTGCGKPSVKGQGASAMKLRAKHSNCEDCEDFLEQKPDKNLMIFHWLIYGLVIMNGYDSG